MANKFFHLERDIAKLEFNKSIAGCFRDGNAEYDEVGVLLLTWREDDMNCKEKEVLHCFAPFFFTANMLGKCAGGSAERQVQLSHGAV